MSYFHMSQNLQTIYIDILYTLTQTYMKVNALTVVIFLIGLEIYHLKCETSYDNATIQP